MLNKQEDFVVDQDDDDDMNDDDPDYEVKSEDSSNDNDDEDFKSEHICLICKCYFDTKEKLYNHGCANVFVNEFPEDLPLSQRKVRKT